jgi:predicted RNA-binding Zn ribbon-like protein
MSPVPPDEPALALAIDFLNTYDALETPPDRLSVDVVQRIAGRHGYPVTFAAADVEPLRALREQLRPVFAAAGVDAKLAALNGVLANATAHVGRVGDRIRLSATGGTDAVSRFGILVADALAQAMAAGGPDRFGTCVADPCRCVYVDRTRSGRQRYCCELCNDRVAAAAYRNRRGDGTTSGK